MFYRAARRLPTSYSSQFLIIRRPEDRILAAFAIGLAVFVLPHIASAYTLSTLLVPFLIFSISAIGLNLLMGYAGQASLGSGAFIAVGAFASYKLATNLPQLPLVLAFFFCGLWAPLVCLVF